MNKYAKILIIICIILLASSIRIKKTDEVFTAGTFKSLEIQKNEEPKKEANVYLGKFETTAYCSCVKCCGKNNGITATGVKAKANRTVAVDPKKIKYGTKLLINGVEYIAEDTGGAIKGNRIDIYFNTHEEAVKYGRKTVDVYFKKGD